MEQIKKPVFLIKKYKDILWAISAIEVATFFVSCADTLIAGNIIGKEALAAVGTVAPFMMLVTFFSGIVQWRIFRYDRLQCNIDFLPSVYCFSPYGSS